MRARDLGIRIGEFDAGEIDAITDVAGVAVGHTTLISGDGQLRVGHGPVRTGVTVIVPPGIDERPLFAGCHRLNGNGELTGLEWIRESGMLTTPIALTNTHSVGVVRDGLIRANLGRRLGRGGLAWSLPVVGETWDGMLNDIDGFHVRAEHVEEALAQAAPGPVAEGSVGGGTGMICHEFKGGVGTASRALPEEDGGFTVGVLVQANHGRRERLRVDGVPVGEAIPKADVPSPYDVDLTPPPGTGSIIVIAATDAPLLPHQCARLAQRAGLGVARAGGVGENGSGDIFLAFATGNPDLPAHDAAEASLTTPVTLLSNERITPLFDAVVEATEEAILNALLAAQTMSGRDGITAYALDAERLVEAMRRYGRAAGLP